MKHAPLSLGFTAASALAVACAFALMPAAKADFVKVSSLSIAPGGVFYYGAASESVVVSSQHAVIVQAANGGAHLTNIDSVYNNIVLGYNGGDWLGTGLTSHQAATDAAVNQVLAVMLFDNTQLGYANWLGATNLDTIPDGNFNQVLTRMTYQGDFTGDGVITADDYGLLDFYLASALPKQGDLNGNGSITADDYGILDYVLATQVYGSLGNAVAPFAGGKGGSVVPEPTSGILLMSGAACLAALRRRRKLVGQPA